MCSSQVACITTKLNNHSRSNDAQNYDWCLFCAKAEVFHIAPQCKLPLYSAAYCSFQIALQITVHFLLQFNQSINQSINQKFFRVARIARSHFEVHDSVVERQIMTSGKDNYTP